MTSSYGDCWSLGVAPERRDWIVLRKPEGNFAKQHVDYVQSRLTHSPSLQKGSPALHICIQVEGDEVSLARSSYYMYTEIAEDCTTTRRSES